MKKIAALFIFVLLLSFALIACNSNNSTNEGSNGSENEGSENVKPEYTITWINESGDELGTTKVKEGEVPSYAYSVADSAKWDYTFVGWASDASSDALSSIPAASADASYYAVVTKVKKTYTVTFDSCGGSDVDSVTVEYGATVSEPAAPEYEGHKFVGWCLDKNGSTPVDFASEITGNVTYYAVWNEVVDVKALLKTLLEGYSVNPISYLPEAMLYNYSANLVNSDDIVSDYSDFVDVSDVSYGFGEQWRMVLDNIQQSNLFFNALSVVESVASTSMAVFNNYFDQNPSDTARHEFASGIYNVTVDFDGDTIYYVLDYTATFPIVGEQTAQIALAMDAESGDKTVRVQLGDANALKYTVTEDSYEFAIKYLGVRRAMFSVETDDNGDVSGKIFEYLTVASAEVASAAEFYVTDEYVSVVGNKADGMLLFTGYINELYDVDTGKMYGYEVKEELSSIVYNTLWFNLSDVGGLNSIKYSPKTDSTDAKVFVNGSNSVWSAKKVGFTTSLTKGGSRRFDIEFRTQYVYSYDAANDTYVEHKISVPMLFVQEEMLDTLTADILAQNGVSVSLAVSSNALDKIMDDYDELIPQFVEDKDLVTVDVILAFIGEKISFEEENV